MRFLKGHGTHNDFVVLPDPDHSVKLDEALVRAICHRRTGIGADGVLRVVPHHDTHTTDDVRMRVRWFMDYRNADGSFAEMCGNGIRVFARYLVDAGLEPAGRIAIATRAGTRIVVVPVDGPVAVEMGTADRLPDAKVALAGQTYPATGWSLGNPHLVVTDITGVGALDLTRAPAVDPPEAYPSGVNVEFVEPDGPRRIRMRVYERGAGETHSCGTGACAAAVAVMAAAGERSDYEVATPGGLLQVGWRDDGSVLLTGPALIVAEGQLDTERLYS